MQSASRRGISVLEVIVALTILGTGVVASLRLTERATAAVALARRTELAADSASAFLDKVALWSADDLDRRLGVHEQGPWRLAVDRNDDLYHVEVLDSTGRRKLLETTMHRSRDSQTAHAY